MFLVRRAYRVAGFPDVTTITDSDVADGATRLNNAILRKLTRTGVLSPSVFVVDSKAHDKKDYIIYSGKRGTWSYDPDGSGHSNPIPFAKLKPGLALTPSDFMVI